MRQHFEIHWRKERISKWKKSRMFELEKMISCWERWFYIEKIKYAEILRLTERKSKRERKQKKILVEDEGKQTDEKGICKVLARK